MKESNERWRCERMSQGKGWYTWEEEEADDVDDDEDEEEVTKKRTKRNPQNLKYLDKKKKN